MDNNVKTIAFVGAAVVLWVVASLTGPRAVSNELFKDEGEEFFPEFKDPAAATELEVWQCREDSGELVPFDVKKNEKGVWTIPSHFDYPADAKTRMAKSAAMLVGLKRDRFVSDSKDAHAACGVVDPKEENLDLKGRGTRVAFKDKGGAVLAELIIGKEVEGKTDMHYVRIPEKKRVYAARLDNQLSTKFADWIETDLLKAQSWDIAKVVFDNYKVDEQAGTIVKGDRIEVSKDDASKWTLAGIAANEEPNEDKLREVGDTLTQLKIVGVRHKPEGLDAALKQAKGFDRVALQQLLADKGYYMTRDGSLVSNEGDLLFETRKGVRYTLRFGEIVFGEGDEVTSGKAPDKPKDQKPPKDGEQQGPQPKAGNNRYLMVTAEFDEALVKKPSAPKLADDVLDKRRTARQRIEAITGAIDAYKQKHDGKLPESLAKLTEKPNETDPAPLDKLDKDPWDMDYVMQPNGDTFVVLSYGADKKEGGEFADMDVRSDQLPKEDELRRQTDEWKQYDKKIEDGRKEAESLTKLFEPWYYVIGADLFTKLKPQRKDLVKEKAKPAEATPPASTGHGGAQEPVK
jgi:hypothetical protein